MAAQLARAEGTFAPSTAATSLAGLAISRHTLEIVTADAAHTGGKVVVGTCLPRCQKVIKEAARSRMVRE